MNPDHDEHYCQTPGPQGYAARPLEPDAAPEASPEWVFWAIVGLGLVAIAAFIGAGTVASGAEIIRYVDPDAAGTPEDGTTWAKAYASLNAALTAEAADLASAGNTLRFKLHSSGTDDTTAASTGTSYTTGAANYITIDANSTYTLAVTNAVGLTISENYVRVVGLNVEMTESGTSNARGVSITGTAGDTDIRIIGCRISGACSGTGQGQGILLNDTGSTLSVANTIVTGFVSGSDNGFQGLDAIAGTVSLYNCTLWNNYEGLLRPVAGGTVTAVNCAVGNNTDDFSGTITADYCCSDDGDGTHAQTPSGGDWANELSNAAEGDFTLVAGGNCIDRGTDDPGSGLYADDFAGIDRDTYSPWDIGAYESEEGGAGGEGNAGSILNPAIFGGIVE
jgi:hypothetical protein